MATVFQDLRFGFRTLARRPLYVSVAVVTLGLGIGSATAMYSVVARVLFESVPFREPRRVVNVWLTADWAVGQPGLVGRTWDRLPLSFDEYRAWQAGNTVFDGVAVHNAVETTLTGLGPAERISIGIGSASLLSVLGVEPVLGRWFRPEEEGVVLGQASPVTVLSYETWQRRLGGDPGVLGRTLVLDGANHSIIGVLPAGFRLRHLGMHWLGEDQKGVRDVWVPLGTPIFGNGNNLEAVARLRPGVTSAQALGETRAILLANRNRGDVRIVPRTEDETHGLSSPLLLLFGATGLLLLIACANIATLSLGELHGRRPELITRSALGAGRHRLVRQLLTESLLLGVLGTVVGATLAVAGTWILVALAPPLPRVEAVRVDLRVLAFAASLGLLAVAAFGTLPAFLAAHRSAVGSPAAARTATRRRAGFERWLVSLEIALTVVILVASGLLGRSLGQLLAVDPGFEPEGLATVRVFISGTGYQTREEVSRVQGELVAAIEAIPGVTHASAITRLPFPGLTNTTTLTVLGAEGRHGPQISAQQLYVAPGYHETMGIPLLAGEPLPVGTSRSMIVSENIARRYWPAGSPLGSQVARGGGTTIVGIVGNVKRNALGVEADRAFYMPLRGTDRDVSLVARTSADAHVLAGRMRDAVRAYDPDIPVRQVATLADLVAASASQEWYRTMLMTVFGALATLLAAVGVFGVTAQGVVRRTKEMGVRMSLGAEQRHLVGTVVGGALRTGAAGVVGGLIGAAWVGRWLSGLLFGVNPLDPPTYVFVAALLALVCAVASFLPARRIAGIDPARVLRAE